MDGYGSICMDMDRYGCLCVDTDMDGWFVHTSPFQNTHKYARRMASGLHGLLTNSASSQRPISLRCAGYGRIPEAKSFPMQTKHDLFGYEPRLSRVVRLPAKVTQNKRTNKLPCLPCNGSKTIRVSIDDFNRIFGRTSRFDVYPSCHCE